MRRLFGRWFGEWWQWDLRGCERVVDRAGVPQGGPIKAGYGHDQEAIIVDEGYVMFVVVDAVEELVLFGVGLWLVECY